MNYKDSGVDIEEATSALNMSKKYIIESYNKSVLSSVGSYGGMFDISNLGVENPVLVSSTDSIGTKIDLAIKNDMLDYVGYDIVNHSINDILVQGAKPLYFLDYLGINKCDKNIITRIIRSISYACKVNNCPLIGGEIAELHKIYNSDCVDIVGTIVGVVDKKKIISGKDISPGDVILGLKSSGLHTNGYSLATKALEGYMSNDIVKDLLKPHTCYSADLSYLFKNSIKVKGLVHITGGGFYDNPSRILRNGLGCEIIKGSWTPNSIFNLIQEKGKISNEEMFKVFNMGIGMFVIINKEDYSKALELSPNACHIGQIIESEDTVRFV